MSYSALPRQYWPEGYRVPEEVQRLLDCGLVDWDPWHICHGQWLLDLHKVLRDRYPSWLLVPVAKRGDNDDTACWDVGGEKIVVVHLGADVASAKRRDFDSFWDFLDVMYADFVERSKEEVAFSYTTRWSL